MSPESLATLSHELRGPLNAIIGFSEALRDGLVGPMTDAQREYVCDIFDGGQRLLALIDDMAGLPKVEEGKAAVQFASDNSALAGSGGGAVLAAGSAGGKPFAMVVDDDDRASDLLRLFLEAEGFAVLRAVSAEEALLILPRQAVALITLDLEMYGMNGWQCLEQMRESSNLGHAHVVIVSGRSVKNIAPGRGAAASLQKPINRGQLRGVLADLGLLKAA